MREAEDDADQAMHPRVCIAHDDRIGERQSPRAITPHCALPAKS